MYKMPLYKKEYMKKWRENNRNYFEYSVDTPAPFNWHIGSAKYKLKHKGTIEGVNYQIISDEKHPFNIDMYSDIIEKAIRQFITKEYNEKSINFHKKLGFSIDTTITKKHFDGDNYHNIIGFKYLIKDWQKDKNKGDLS